MKLLKGRSKNAKYGLYLTLEPPNLTCDYLFTNTGASYYDASIPWLISYEVIANYKCIEHPYVEKSTKTNCTCTRRLKSLKVKITRCYLKS